MGLSYVRRSKTKRQTRKRPMERKALGHRNVWTIVEVAAYLRVHPGTVYRLTRTGKLPAFKVGGEWRFFSDMIDDWLISQGSGKQGH